MLRLLFLASVLCFTGVSATFNVLFSLTLSEGPERYAWVVFGVGAALYSGLALDMIRTNWRRGAPSKSVAAAIFLLPAFAWDARCAYGFASMEQERARMHVADESRKRINAERKAVNARKALEPYANAPEPIAADAAVDALAKRTNDQRCALRTLPDDIREICDQLSQARIDAARAHAKTRLTKALDDAENELAATKAPPPRDALADLVGPEWAHWLPWFPAIVLQLGTLFGMFAASVPSKPRPAAEMPANRATRAAEGPSAAPTAQGSGQRPKAATPQIRASELMNGKLDVVSTVALLLNHPDQCPPGTGVDSNGWLAGPQRVLATRIGIPVSRFNKELKAAVAAGRIEMDTTGGVTRLKIVRH